MRDRRLVPVTMAVAMAATLAACDPVFGVQRRQDRLPGPPAFACVAEAMRSVPGVEAVREGAFYPEGRSLTPDGIPRDPNDHEFSYRYDGEDSHLAFTIYPDGRVAFSHDFEQIGRVTPPFQAKLDRRLPVMRAIDEAIFTRCGLRGPVVERCTGGVRCAPP